MTTNTEKILNNADLYTDFTIKRYFCDLSLKESKILKSIIYNAYLAGYIKSTEEATKDLRVIRQQI